MDKYKILLVDDEQSEREGVSFLIERYGYPLEIKQASNGQKALELMEREAFDILFTDVKMPVMDGLTLAKEVARAYPETVIIIFSAYSEFDYAKRALEARVVNYLLKPVEVEEFRSCMEDVIERIRKNRAEATQDQENQERVREALLHRVFLSRRVPEGEEERLKELLFAGEQEGCLPVFFEFTDNYFEHNAEAFQKMARVYFQGVTFSEILPGIAYLLLRSPEYKDGARLKEQLEKLLKALKRRQECLVVVGKMVFSLEELLSQLTEMDEVRREVFGYGDRILYAGDGGDRQARYARDIEAVKNDIFSAIEGREPDKIREGCRKLQGALSVSRDLSRIYIQHLLYSIVKELYDKMPQVGYEDALVMAEEFFSRKTPEKVLSDFSAVVDRILTAVPEDNKEESELIARIKRFIQKNYKSELGLGDVASAVGLAPAYVSHIFKKETGQGIVEYITELKMKKARQLLKDKSLKIVQVAKICGYENQSYFNKLFKSYYGMTPVQYREGL